MLTSMPTRQNRIHVARLDMNKPLGIHKPKRPGDIGWDLEAMETVHLAPGEHADIPVNARIQLPTGYYADIRNRSSMSRRGLYVDQNLIDTGYRGPLFVFVRCMSAEGNKISAGERIAQLVFQKANPVHMLEMPSIELDSERGERGFGSTGT